MTKVEKPNRTPPTRPEPTAVPMVRVRVKVVMAPVNATIVR